MPSIDIHAHVLPQCFWRAVDAGRDWYGTRFEADSGATVTDGKQSRIPMAKVRFTPEERLADMDAEGTDVQVVSLHTPLFSYHLEAAQGRQLARDVNDEISGMVRQWPRRFAGLATLPVQDVPLAIDELERAVHVLGLKGAELDTVVNDANWDEPRFLPLFQAAEAMGAVLFFHPQPHHNLVMARTTRYGLANSIGVIAEDALIAATLILGGILEACPDLKVCIAHGAGPACFGMGRLDRGWQVRTEARQHILTPPSAYRRRLYYDCLTNSETALRFLIDRVGADRVVLGSDWPFVPWDPSPSGWVQNLQSLTQEEKDKILWKNLEQLLALSVPVRARTSPAQS
jgi:aminocarboxymuconate-semialdehyde decarboxylase